MAIIFSLPVTHSYHNVIKAFTFCKHEAYGLLLCFFVELDSLWPLRTIVVCQNGVTECQKSHSSQHFFSLMWNESICLLIVLIEGHRLHIHNTWVHAVVLWMFVLFALVYHIYHRHSYTKQVDKSFHACTANFYFSVYIAYFVGPSGVQKNFPFAGASS